MSPNALRELSRPELSQASRLLVAGDIHGDYETFLQIRDLFDPERDYLIFLGDYADRGPGGIEVVDGVAQLASKYSSRVIALKGNHESYTEDGRPTFTPCDLPREASRKREEWQNYFNAELKPFIKRLHIAALVPGEVLFVHGGVSSKVHGVEDLRHPSRALEEDLLWSDPFEGDGEQPNPRGAGIAFGRKISEEVCHRLAVRRIVRSHEPRKASDGPCIEHDGRVITVSSTTVYGGAAFLLAPPTGNLEEALEHLEGHVLRLR